MQIVIDIDDDMYKSVANNDAYVLGDVDWILLENAIANGTPLPEHHGRLIDADAFQQYCFNKNFDKRLSDEGLAIINFYLTFQPTIIEGSESK